MKLYEYVDDCLSRVGVKKVFGIPGALVMPIWQCIKDKEIILCSHEQEASYVATGYSKMAKEPVCVITTGGPGVTNCISGIASANIDSVPLIYISGRTPIEKNGYGLRQEESKINRLYDSVNILSELTKKSVCVDNLENATEIIRDTIQLATQGRWGAVHLSIPVDYQNCEVMPVNWGKNYFNKYLDRRILSFSKRPIFIIGWGCWMSDSYGLVYALAEKINAPIVVSSKAYCCIKNDHKLYLGKLGYGYNSIIDTFIEEYEADSIISFGSSLGEKDIKDSVLYEMTYEIPTYVIANDCSFLSYRDATFIAIETDDLYNYILRLYENVEDRYEDVLLYNRIDMVKKCVDDYWRHIILPSDSMAKCISYINNIIGEDVVITADAGNHLLNTGALVVPDDFGKLFLDVGLRAMGNGICTSIGMAIADRSKIYVAITGDGCMLMNGNVMHLANKMNLPIIFVVFNNNALGRVRVGQSKMSDYRGTDIDNVDFMSYGRTFGLDTYKYQSVEEFVGELRGIVLKRKPSLVEVVTDNNEIPVAIKENIY